MKRIKQHSPFAKQEQRARTEVERQRASLNNASLIHSMYKTHAWKKMRAVMLHNFPNCNRCGNPATTVDHITPHKGAAALFYDLRNLMALCKRCHDSKTARHDGGFGRDITPAPHVDRPRIERQHAARGVVATGMPEKIYAIG
jgi:5-methylcytosine-specific restriction protein A